jgi:GNAT superfamily N-acetyltransferase
MHLTAREATMDDVAAITMLSNQLGYSMTEASTKQNLEAIRGEKNEMVLVAICNETVAGWMHVFRTVRLESGAFFEIGGLVVAEKFRRKGIGRLLINEARSWCSQNPLALRVRCNVKRKEAHDFYKSLGFLESKEQKVFEIKLSS